MKNYEGKSMNAAKDFVINLWLYGNDKPCDIDNKFKPELPNWFNVDLFKRGQKYFRDNRAGILLSNLHGLLVLISEPKGATLLDQTGMSSNPETARKRYSSTLMHMISWYECELQPGSQSWESLVRVRKMHFSASTSGKAKGIGIISQVELTLTQFGFMGYVLTRPHLLGIRYNNKLDQEGFVHFWAVIGYMLGIEDQFNMCLLPLEVVEKICQICIRYIFVPILQLELPVFKKLTTSFLSGMEIFFPNLSYNSTLFNLKRLTGIPGYQYKVDLSKEFFCDHVFSVEECQTFSNILDAIPGEKYKATLFFQQKLQLLGTIRESDSIDEVMQSMTVQEINEDEIVNYLNDDQFYQLSADDQKKVNQELAKVKVLDKFTGRLLSDMFIKSKISSVRYHIKYGKLQTPWYKQQTFLCAFLIFLVSVLILSVFK